MSERISPIAQSENSVGSARFTSQQINEIFQMLGPVARRKDSVMNLDDFYRLMRSATEQQKDILLQISNHIMNSESLPLQLFITGPAGCGKTFIVKMIKKIYNTFTKSDGHFNSYVACAPTVKSALAIDGTTIHKALNITQRPLNSLSDAILPYYRMLFEDVRVIIIDEVNMVGEELLYIIDARLKEITTKFDVNFGGLDVIVIGDLRQLQPIQDTPIYKQRRTGMIRPFIWRDFKYYELTQVLRQENQMFAELLTKVGNGKMLNEVEISLINSRFFTPEEADRLCPDGIRILDKSVDIDVYNITKMTNRARTVHQRQGDTYERIVYQYKKTHQLPLVYVALSRVKTIEGLYIITENDDFQFYHCRKDDVSVSSLKREFERLSSNKLTELDASMKAVITNQLFAITVNETDDQQK